MLNLFMFLCFLILSCIRMVGLLLVIEFFKGRVIKFYIHTYVSSCFTYILKYRPRNKRITIGGTVIYRNIKSYRDTIG